MSAIDWHILRPLDGSQQKAFEELCAQLASSEAMPTGARFVRKGAPDAGIECYWELRNGDQYGWQAKFFLEVPGTSQWSQLDESVQRALDRHDHLRQYTVCLPIDRPDPLDPRRASFMDRWNARVRKWREWAGQQGLTVNFEYWGQSELLARLSQERHRGRYYFWFNKEWFSRDWFRQKLDAAIANVDRRYLPSMNIDLPVRECFRGLGRTPDFFDEFDRTRGELRRKLAWATNRLQPAYQQLVERLRTSVASLIATLTTIDRSECSEIPLARLSHDAREAIQLVDSFVARILEAAREKPQPGQSDEPRRSAESDRYYLYELQQVLVRLKDRAEHYDSLLANTPALLLVGHAGVGKTHLLCDVALKRESQDQCTLLLLGEQFSREQPWTQILKLLGLDCNVEEFLGALNAAGELRRSRTLIMIDALNEGGGIHLWHNHLGGLLAELRRFPWIGLALTVRETYEDAVVPSGLVPSRLIRVRHHGFTGLESVAVTQFFGHYGIATPAVPLMQPEFSNPLFLRLFCEAIANQGLGYVPAGLENLTGLFDFFLDSVNSRLARTEYLNFDNRVPLVRQAVRQIAQRIAETGRNWLVREDARGLLDALHPSSTFESSLLRHLLNEGILSQDRFRTESGVVEGIRFSYERFSDHEIAKLLLDRFLDPADPARSFSIDQPLGELIKDDWNCWEHAGVVSALAILVPERTGRDLPDVAPYCASFPVVRDAVLESLIWRRHDAFLPATLNYLNEHLWGLPDTADKVLRAMISISSQPGHPYNAELLHRNLLMRKMAERDAWWSIFLHNEYQEEQNSIGRILDWVELPKVQTSISEESLILVGIALAWFLASSNRFLRDRTTKALVALFTGRIRAFCRILEKFTNVDDLYVLERLQAVAYGCATRSVDKRELGILAQWCYDAIFRGSSPPHILLRDYARGVIERALNFGAEMVIDHSRIEPPYDSKWPQNIPSEEQLRPLGAWEEAGSKVHPSQASIYSSVMGWGDFARYIIGTNSGFFDWQNLRLGRPTPPSLGEIRERFLASLSTSQHRLWLKAEQAQQNYVLKSLLSRFKTESEELDEADELGKEEAGVLERAAQLTGERFAKSLKRGQLRTYRRHILADKEPPGNEHRFDLSIIQRFVLNRVFEMGWTAERFGEFDRYVNRYSDSGRGTQKAERIGKKYQWMAYHEALARVADNFIFCEWWGHKVRPYEGAWQVGGVRDIDPSFTVRSTARSRHSGSHFSWWAPSYGSWREIEDELDWLRRREDMPRIEKVVQLSDPEDGSHWVTLQGYYTWEEPTPPDREWGEIPHREIWYHLRSYLVRKQDFAEMFAWAQRQNYMGRWMPESHDVHKVFLGEFFWSPAYRDTCASVSGQRAWTSEHRGGGRVLPKPVIVTAQEYLWEASFDCSIEGSISTHVPSPWLAEKLNLKWFGEIGAFCDSRGRIVACDPSVNAAGPPALLIRESTLRKLLRRTDCEILWTILGEKRILGGGLSGPYLGRNEISGAMAVQGKNLRGRITSRFRRFS